MNNEDLDNDSFINSKEFIKIQEQHILAILNLLFSKNINFQIRIPAEKVALDPLLPMDILFGFEPNILFDISEYSFETFSINGSIVSFLAGFGDKNPIESMVSSELKDINMILKDNKHLLLNNLTAFLDDEIIEDIEDGINKSMNVFKKNKENTKFFD